ncbi:response regulator [Actinoplanes sp. HUAS TT8]|uniref:response regulator n=1 Tax=Actinoplanes sp. HUAS TT8 TaxID=3447453 RepID=UPI003F51CA51
MATIVLAEDDPDIREISLLLLRRAGHAVIPAGDGEQGWRAVLFHNPDLVISDVDMPEMDGFELCEAIRGNPATEYLPVICISGVLMPGDDRVLRIGANLLLHKPFAGSELLSCVNTALNHAGAVRAT